MKEDFVLLIDDEPNVTSGLRRALRFEPYRILTANSAVQAFEILRSEPVDVIVSDEQMPGMRGSEFFSIVRKRYPNTIRIILTGQANLNAAVRAINEGEIYRFLIKPCREEELVLTIRQGLREKHLKDKATRLLAMYRRQAAILDQLEKKHPGITAVDRDETDAIILEDAPSDYEKLIQELGMEIKKYQKGENQEKGKRDKQPL